MLTNHAGDSQFGEAFVTRCQNVDQIGQARAVGKTSSGTAQVRHDGGFDGVGTDESTHANYYAKPWTPPITWAPQPWPSGPRSSCAPPGPSPAGCGSPGWKLTASERRIAELAANGLTNREIAQTHFITDRTVEAHLTHGSAS
jgi:hypothetical protein